MPYPSSVTRMSFNPPLSISICILLAPESNEFSMSSFTTDAGRSTTSPAATLEASASGIIFMGLDGGDCEDEIC